MSGSNAKHKAAVSRAIKKVRHAERTLYGLGRPFNLTTLIRDGRLVEEVEKAYATHDVLNALLDALEASDPERARRLPWYEAREAWKRAGRPLPPWYEVLLRSHRMAMRRVGQYWETP